MLIGSGEASARLEDAVAGIPITSILVETDAPFVLPDVYKRQTISRLEQAISENQVFRLMADTSDNTMSAKSSLVYKYRCV